MKIEYCLVIAIMTHESITLDLVFSNKMERQSVSLPFLSSTPRACARRKMRVRCVPCPKVMGLYQIKKMESGRQFICTRLPAPESTF